MVFLLLGYAATALRSRTGGRRACPNFFLFNQEVAPLAFIAEFLAPHSPVGELEERVQVRSAGRLHAPDCVIRFRYHAAPRFIGFCAMSPNGGTISAQHAVPWVGGGHAQPWRARSLP